MNQNAGRHSRSASLNQGQAMPEGLLSDTIDPSLIFKRKIGKAFESMDSDGSGGMDRQEFRTIMNSIKIKLREQEVDAVFETIDTSKNGIIDLEEFEYFLEYPFPARNKIRFEFLNQIDYPERFIKYHTWVVNERPLNFVLKPGVDGATANFGSSTDPKMSALIQRGSRLTYINQTRVERADFMDIERTLQKIPLPIKIVFQTQDTIKQSKMQDHEGRFQRLNGALAQSVLYNDEVDMFDRPYMTMRNQFEEATDVKKFKNYFGMKYYGHCKHCPQEDSWKLKIHLLMEDENDSALSRVMQYFIMGLIFVSTAAYIFQTVPRFENWHWNTTEAVVSILFSIEFTLRLLGARNIRKYFQDPLNVVDFLAVLPWWLEILTAGKIQAAVLRVIRVVRLLRLIRLTKTGALAETMETLSMTIAESMVWLVMFLMLGLLTLVVFASFAYIAEIGTTMFINNCDSPEPGAVCSNTTQLLYSQERTQCTDTCLTFCTETNSAGCCSYHSETGYCAFYKTATTDPAPTIQEHAGLCRLERISARKDEDYYTPYASVVHSMWITCVTMMMVGYGDYYPTTPFGKVIAAMSGLMGLLFMALPVIVVGFHFTIAVVRIQYKRLPSRVDKALPPHKKGTIRKLLQEVNESIKTQMFTHEDELVLLGFVNQLNTRLKMEQILRFDTGWAYLPFAEEHTPGLPRISQFKLFVLFGLFGRKYQRLRRAHKRREMRFKSDLGNLVRVRATSGAARQGRFGEGPRKGPGRTSAPAAKLFEYRSRTTSPQRSPQRSPEKTPNRTPPPPGGPELRPSPRSPEVKDLSGRAPGGPSAPSNQAEQRQTSDGNPLEQDLEPNNPPNPLVPPHEEESADSLPSYPSNRPPDE